MRVLKILFLMVFSITNANITAFAQSEQPTQKRFALVIGNANYTGKSLSPLKNPTNDAALISDSLKRTGFEVTLVMDANLRDMKVAVAKFTKKLQSSNPPAIGLFYYSGHGFQAANINYLAPLGANLKDEVDAEFEALSVDWVLAKLERAHKGPNIVLLDACRNTALSRSIRSTGQGLALLKKTPRGSFISYATAPGSTATDGKGLNSPYTAAIAREILQPGSSIEKVFKNVRRSVVKATNGDQVPWDYSSLTTDITFVPSATAEKIAASGGANTNATQVELQMWNDVKNTGSIKHLQAYVDRFPTGPFATIAKLEIDKIERGETGDALSPQIEKLFAKLSSRSLIIEKPTRPHEFYANARMHELQGDYPKARQDYLKYFAFKQVSVDPHYRFQNFLRIQEGRAGAREFYLSLSQGNNDPTLQFARALLAEKDLRIDQLKAYIKKHPDFAPAYYELSRDYSALRLGQQSLADKKNEYELLTKFTELSKQGKFLKYFIDQQLAAKQVKDSKQRLAALSYLNKEVLVNPIKLNPSRSNSGWMINIGIADQVNEIFVAHSGNPPVSTGFLPGSINPTTGKPIAYPMVELPPNAGPRMLKISYTDIHGKTQGPFDVFFDPANALIASQKNILERFPNGWLGFRLYDGKQLVYFSHLITYRCSLEKIEYGIDEDQPNKEFKLLPCDPLKPHRVDFKGKMSKIFFAIPKSSKFMTIKLSYKDGTQSKINRFEITK